MTGAEVPLAEQVSEAVLGHPSVRRLDRGEFGVIAACLPGRQVAGVRLGEGAAPVEIGVVLRLDHPIPEILDELRQRVTAVTGSRRVDITVSDVVPEGETREPEPQRAETERTSGRDA